MLDGEGKKNLIKELWEDGDSGRIIAQKLTLKTRATVTRSAVLGFYNRNKDLAGSHPLLPSSVDIPKSKKKRDWTLYRSSSRRRDGSYGRFEKVRDLSVNPREGKEGAFTIDLDGYDEQRKKVAVPMLEATGCKMPYDVEDGDDFPDYVTTKFCDAKCKAGSSYCEHHHNVMWVKPKKGAA